MMAPPQSFGLKRTPGFTADTRRDADFEQTLSDGIDLLPTGGGIYCILTRTNGKLYVGQAKNIRQRCLQHRSELGRGVASNMLMRRDATLQGLDAFYFALQLDGIADTQGPANLNQIEVWFALQLGANDERRGYNQEAGHHRTRAARFRERERKLMRYNSCKYELLEGVNLYDAIHPGLLSSWVPGS